MTKKIKEVVYGIGGYDDSKPDKNVIEIVYYTKDELVEVEAKEVKAQAKAAAQAKLAALGLTVADLEALGL